MIDILKIKSMNKKFQNRELSLYLIVGTICVLVYSLVIPLFLKQQDEFYHFDCSAYLSNVVIDRKDDEEYKHYVKDLLEKENYLKDLYFTRVKTIDREDVVSKKVKLQKKYEFWGHIIPAIGMKLGFFIYPSIGVMAIFSRLFSGIVYLFCMYFIIKAMKYGKRLFMAVSLTPAVLPLLASMSYDGLNFVIVSFFLMTVINLSVKKKFVLLDFLPVIFASLILYFCSKTNMILMLMLPIALLLIRFVVPFFYEKLSFLNKKRWRYLSFLLIIFLCTFIFFYVTRLSGDGVAKIFLSLNSEVYIYYIFSILGGIYSVQSVWLGLYWFIVMFIIISNEKSNSLFRNNVISWLSMFLFFVNFFYLMIFYKDWTLNNQLSSDVISGIQGRYFTPYILPFAMIGASDKYRRDDSILKLDSLIFGGAVISLIFVAVNIYVFEIIF
ncbi:MAG: DUF2142 domain-containing protein [Lactobacillales bacterium]|jgi:uncharacterized membrane protein|nr:DUF2142 domain-containing protein [Lactobacillales bacterium]